MNIEEYNSVRGSGAGILDFPNRGLIEVSGAEAIQFLNGLITNDVKKLENNRWMLAAFPNVQGRLLAFARVLKIGDKFLFDTEAETRDKVFQNLFRFTFAGDFKVNDLSNDFSLISLQGKLAEKIHSEFFKVKISKSEVVEAEFGDEQVLMIRATHTAENGFDFIAPKAVLENLSNEFLGLGAVKIGDATREVLRIEASLPKYGTDVDESTVVLESNLDEAVSFQKGCYVGQEIIARIHFRGHVAKKLTGLILDGNDSIAPNETLKSAEGKAAGRITSTVFSPALQKQIALGFVRYEFLAPETGLFVGENQTKAHVTALPFVRSGWNENL